MSRIITVAAIKGGVGKTTIATNIAAKAAIDGYKVLLIDADKQASSSLFFSSRTDTAPRVTTVQLFGRDIDRNGPALAENYDITIVDVGAKDSPELRAGMLIADTIVSVLCPGQYDMWTLDDMEQLLAKLPDTKVITVLNRCDTRVKEYDQALDYLAQSQSTGPIHTITKRTSIARGPENGLSVWEYKPTDSKAIGEFDILTQEIFA
jgi:chromosome partitioning protein